MTDIRFKPRLPRAILKIEMQRDIVRTAYAKTNSLNSTYQREFKKLSDMINDYQIEQFRKQFGVNKTPYDNVGGNFD